MASFIDLMARRIDEQRHTFLSNLSRKAEGEEELLLATGMQKHWHAFEPGMMERPQRTFLVGAVDGSRATRALNSGADWLITQALLIGPGGYRSSAVDTHLIRGETERPAIDRLASLLMRSLELQLAREFVESGKGNLLLLDGSLYADLPYLLYNLAIGGYEDQPLKVLEQYLDLFELCQQRDILLLGVSKSARSTVFGRTLLDTYGDSPLPQTNVRKPAGADVQEETEAQGGDASNHAMPRRRDQGTNGFPTDGELLHRWTEGPGLSDAVLLGSSSFIELSMRAGEKLDLLARQPPPDPQQPPGKQSVQTRLLKAPAIGTFYVRLAPGDDVLRIDALANTFGRNDLRLLGFKQMLVPYTTALPLVQHLLDEYGGMSVYNAALYVVDQEVRLRAEMVDHVYLSVLRSQLGVPIRYDRSTRRFLG